MYAYGYFKESGRIDINWSSIATKLIKLAAECEAYSSDIVYDLVDIENSLRNGTMETCTKWFGFRDMGVDHEAFMSGRLSSTCYGSNPYREIWRLDINIDTYESEVEMHLYEVTTEEAREILTK